MGLRFRKKISNLLHLKEKEKLVKNPELSGPLIKFFIRNDNASVDENESGEPVGDFHWVNWFCKGAFQIVKITIIEVT
jgi:hypothetical protein